MNDNSHKKITGILLGTAVADSIGLPMEGMSPKRIKRLKWLDESRPLKHHFVFGKGMWSDDTEHTIMLTQALLASGGNLKKFQRSFSWELRWWLLGLPAGVGLATARAIIKLWLGFSVKHSGVFSAGNGSSMRAAMVAAYFPDDQEKRQAFTFAQSMITHIDPKATIGAMAVTELVAFSLNNEETPSITEVMELMTSVGDVDLHGMREVDEARRDWKLISTLMHKAWESGWDAEEFLKSLLKSIGGRPERGVTGYVYQSVPVAIYVGVKENWEFKKVIRTLISLGGDTDTVAAIAGAICGAFGGVEAIPGKWKSGVKEWPCSMTDLERLATAVTKKKKIRVRARTSVPLLLRNILFLGVVLVHGFARLIPR
ncbi:MAG: ADP-ribosyl-[dinitrogen reductase] hydrolase [Cryomorphaceae bacterium]|jgi:ADP-ribosyl-[dinitrogen reductase] hydrolase